MKKLIFLSFCIFLLCSNQLLAQISAGGTPPSFDASLSNARIKLTEVPQIQFQALDMAKIWQEDAENDQNPSIPWRFGIARELDLGLENAGVWDTLIDGSRIWRLKLSSIGAESINLNYDLFYMPEGAEMFVYSSKKNVLGAFTSFNNKKDSAFATLPVPGDEVFVEYYEPADKLGQGKLNIKQLVHGYRDFLTGDKAFNSSGACNINVNCPIADPWQHEKRAVAMITTQNNTSKCTGTLLNNVRQDGTPYFLTAAHCQGVSNSIFVFDYESPICSPSANDTSVYSIVGSVLRSYNNSTTSSDFQLVELSITPPDPFNVFYAGWSAKNISPISSTVIHHPSGDVKKISMDLDSAHTTSYYNDPGPKNHWQINNWDLGTTEGGSSGSALFNEEHKVVGQLHGGYASCGSSFPDWFGKFSYSWDTDTNSAKQLKFWLDPDGTGTMEINGYDPDTPSFALDAEILFMGDVPSYSCDNNVQAFVIVRNVGNDTIHSLLLKLKAGNQILDSVNWNTTLSYLETEKIPLTSVSLPYGKQTFTVFIDQVNSAQDQVNENDSISQGYRYTSNWAQLYLTLKTDDYGSETNWFIRDSSTGDLLYKRGPFKDTTGGEIYRDTLCLYDSCFTFRINDARGDGFNDPSGIYGNGYYLITDAMGDTLIFNDNFTSRFLEESFCIKITSIEELALAKQVLEIFPNPNANGKLHIKTDLQMEEISLYSVQGTLVKTWKAEHFQGNKLDLGTKLVSGVYVLSVKDSEGKLYQKKLVIQ